jgi:hypothetical protein
MELHLSKNMADKRDYESFTIRQTIVISGKTVAKNEALAKSDFHRDILYILRSHGYSARIISNPKSSI